MQNQEKEHHRISRRELLVGMGLTAMAYTPLAGAMQHEHAKHDHSKHKPQQETVLEAVTDCVDKGQRCIAHCLTMFQEGDTSVADCASKVHEMMAICDGFSYLLAANSTHSKGMSALCLSVCKECAEECRKHDQHHECRACAEACEATIAAVEKDFA